MEQKDFENYLAELSADIAQDDQSRANEFDTATESTLMPEGEDVKSLWQLYSREHRPLNVASVQRDVREQAAEETLSTKVTKLFQRVMDAMTVQNPRITPVYRISGAAALLALSLSVLPSCSKNSNDDLAVVLARLNSSNDAIVQYSHNEKIALYKRVAELQK